MAKVTRKQLDAARSASEAARVEYVELRDKYKDEVIVPQVRERIGQCFKYRNSSGGGERWWMYTRIVEEVEGDVLVLNVQRDARGFIGAETMRLTTDEDGNFSGPYEPIEATEYMEAVRPLLDELVDKATLP